MIAMWAQATERRYRLGARGLSAVAPVDQVLVLSLGASAALLDLLRLPGTSLWGDEAFSVELASSPGAVFWRFVSSEEANMVLYHVLLRGWLGITGMLGLLPDELVVRMPSILFSAVATAVVYAVGRRWWGRAAGALGAALLILNEVQLLSAREARSYELEVLLVCLGWYALMAVLSSDRSSRAWWAAFALFMTLALYAHFFSALVVAAQACAVILLLVIRSEWRERARRSVRAAIASFGAIGLAALPLVLYALRHGSTNPQIPPAGMTEVARFAWNVAGHDPLFALALGGAIVLAIALTVRTMRAGLRQRSSLLAPVLALACWLIVPIVLSYAATQPRFNLHLFAWGYLVVVVPALCLFAGIGIASLRRPLVRIGLVVAIISGAAFATPGYSAAPSQDFRAASAWIAERYRPGDGLVATSWSSALGIAYYTRLGSVPSDLLSGSPVPWSWTGPGAIPLDLQAVSAYAAGHGRVFLVESLLAGDSADVKARAGAAGAALAAGSRLVDEIAIPSSLGPVRVRLYEIAQPAYL